MCGTEGGERGGGEEKEERRLREAGRVQDGLVIGGANISSEGQYSAWNIGIHFASAVPTAFEFCLKFQKVLA